MEPTVLTTVGDELEAHSLCEALRAAGFRCNFIRDPNQFSLSGLNGIVGPYQILVDPAHLDRARQALDDSENQDEAGG
jgi:hypothetical protein